MSELMPREPASSKINATGVIAGVMARLVQTSLIVTMAWSASHAAASEPLNGAWGQASANPRFIEDSGLRKLLQRHAANAARLAVSKVLGNATITPDWPMAATLAHPIRQKRE